MTPNPKSTSTGNSCQDSEEGLYQYVQPVDTDQSLCIRNLLVSGFLNIFSVTSCCRIIISLS